MKKRGFEVTGIEPSAESIGLAATHWGVENIHHGVFEDVNLPSEGFGSVTFFHVLEHVRSPMTLLKQLPMNYLLTVEYSIWRFLMQTIYLPP